MLCVRLARCWVLLACLALLILPGEGWAADRRVALVIGNSGYRNAPRLDNPVRDAKAVAEMFKAAGFDSVDLQLDLESLELKRAVRAFLLTKYRVFDDSPEIAQGHERLVNAIRDHKPDLAEELLKSHIIDTAEEVLRILALEPVTATKEG